MNASIQVPRDESYVLVSVEGTVTRNSAREFCGEAVAVAVAESREFLVIDLRNAQSQFSVVDNYEFANADSRKIGLRQFLRVAIAAADPTACHLPFLSDVMHNNGYEWQAFGSVQEASDWLSS